MFSFRSLYFDDTPREGRILDIFEALEPSQEVALFFVHGGGWTGGSRTIYHTIIHQSTRLGFDCASTDYRLSGTTVFDQVGDVRTGLDIFAADLKARNRPAKVLLLGSSAGAHLALLTGLATPQECGAPETTLTTPCEITGIAVQAAPFTFEPWPDIFPAIWGAMQKAVGTPYDTNTELYRQASPMSYIREGNPPLLMQHAQNEHMFPREVCTQFAECSLACGNVVIEKDYPRTEHGFFYSLDRWQQRAAFNDILEFVQTIEKG